MPAEKHPRRGRSRSRSPHGDKRFEREAPPHAERHYSPPPRRPPHEGSPSRSLYRHRSRSRPRRSRSRSRDRLGDRHDREDDRERRRARSRSRSRDRDRDSREKKKARSRSRSRDRDDQDKKRVRSRSHSRDRERGSRRDRSREKRPRSRSSSRSSSSLSDSERRRKRRKEKHKKRRSRSRSRDRDRKDRKKEKKDKKKKSAAVGSQWGKYGVIAETDIYNKEQEFRAWLVEERMLNPETISKDQNKKEFARFVEDFNTATLPHEKFYHMEAYERRMSALRAGEYIPPADDNYDPSADLRALQNQHKRKEVEHESYLSKEQLQALRRVQQERIEAGKMKLLGMDIKHDMGVRMDGTMFDG